MTTPEAVAQYDDCVAGWLGIFIVGLFVFVAIFAPWIAPYSESDSVADTWSAPSAAYWLGTDNIGRDLLSRVMFGARTTIGVALMTTILSFLLGTVMGIWAAVGGKAVDQVLSRIVDVMLSHVMAAPKRLVEVVTQVSAR